MTPPEVAAGVLGYAHPGYARSLAEFGTPQELPRSGGWILERPVPGTPYRDAMGCYPLFFCRSWSKLDADLRDLEGRVVCLSAVPDLFGEYDQDLLRECFGDVVMPFKEHFITDMHRPLADSVSRHHRKYARKALLTVETEVVQDPSAFLDEWIELHRSLVAKHDVKGIRAFSRHAFAMQLSLPGIVVVRAKHGGTTVGAQLWFQHEEVAYGHVLAFNQLGYDVGAPYALYWFALEHFLGKVRWCSIGGVSGTDVAGSGGLSQFKRGWATTTRTAYFCGRIYDRAKYDELVQLKGSAPGGFFPAYRSSL
jgi:hypothetical protein